MGGPPSIDPTLRPKSESKKAGRRNLVVPLPDFMWGVDVWAVATRRSERIDQLLATPPYEKSRITGHVLVDWYEPLLLVVAWEATAPDAYQWFKITPPPPGQLPHVKVPHAYEGSWIEQSLRESEDWA